MSPTPVEMMVVANTTERHTRVRVLGIIIEIFVNTASRCKEVIDSFVEGNNFVGVWRL